MGDLRGLLGTISAVALCCLAMYALIFNPKFGQGDSRTLVLTVGLVLGVVITFVLGVAFFSD